MADQYTLAIVCAIEKEFNTILPLFDGASYTYRGSPKDPNIYIVGRFAGHNAVLMMPGDRGELDAGMCMQRLCHQFREIEITFLVGICGAMAYNGNTNEPIYLGDVIVGTQVWRYLHDARSSQLPHGSSGIEVRNLMTESASQRVKQLGKLLMTNDFRKRTMHLSLSYLKLLQEGPDGAKYEYPGHGSDQLFRHDCLHRHQSPRSRCSCSDPAESNCDSAKDTPCNALGCTGIERVRPQTQELPEPNIHGGVIASADIVMRGRSQFETEFTTNNILGVEMEGGGISKATDCIVIKGAADYADTHKNKNYAHYAAATAASIAKAFIATLYPQIPKSSQIPRSSIDINVLDAYYQQIRSKIPRPTMAVPSEIEDEVGWVTTTASYSSWIASQQKGQRGPSRVFWCQRGEKSQIARLFWPFLLSKNFRVLSLDCKYLPALPSNLTPALSSVILNSQGPKKVHQIVWALIAQSFSMASQLISADSFGEHILSLAPSADKNSEEHLTNLATVLSRSVATWAARTIVILDDLDCLSSVDLDHLDRAIAGLLEGFPHVKVMLHSKVAKLGSLLRDNAIVIDENTAYQECCTTFSFHNMTQRRDHIETACINTNHWIWSNPSYRTWVSDNSSSALWIAGKPGSGKSVLARTIEENLTTRKEFKDAIVSTWLYSIRDNLICQSEMLSGLIFQIISKYKRMFQLILKHYRRKLETAKDVHWKFDELRRIFSEIVCDQSVDRALILVLDGIDESSKNKREGECSRAEMLQFFLRLFQQSPTRRFKMIFLSRPEDDIGNTLRKLPSILMHQVNYDDIEKVTDAGIEKIMGELRALRDSDPDSDSNSDSEGDDRSTRRTTQSQVASRFSRSEKAHIEAKLIRHMRRYLIRNADGVILWVTSVLGHILMRLGSAFCTLQQLVSEIESLSTELSDVYVAIVRNMTMDRNYLSTLELAQRALLWVRLNPALGKFYAQDLLEVLAIDQEEGSGEWAAVNGWRSFHRQLRRLCGPFLEIITQRSGWNCDPYDPVQLLHQTVKTFLDDPKVSSPLYLSKADSQKRFQLDCERYMHKTLPKRAVRRSDPLYPRKNLNLAQMIDNITNYLDDKPLLSFILTFNPGMASLIPRRYQEILRMFILFPSAAGGLGVDSIRQHFYQACKNGRVNAICALFAISSTWLHPWEWYLIEPEVIMGTLQAAMELSLDLQIQHISGYAGTRGILSNHVGWEYLSKRTKKRVPFKLTNIPSPSGLNSHLSYVRRVDNLQPKANATRHWAPVRAINEVLTFWMRLGALPELQTGDAFKGASHPHFVDSSQLTWRMAIIRATAIKASVDQNLARVGRTETPNFGIDVCGIRSEALSYTKIAECAPFSETPFSDALSAIEQAPSAEQPSSLSLFVWQENIREAIKYGSDSYQPRVRRWFRELPPIHSSLLPTEQIPSLV